MMRIRHRRDLGWKSADGFSLIEIMVAVIVFSIGVLGLAALFPMAVRNINQGAMLTRATQQAQGKMEDLLDARYRYAVTGSDTVNQFVRTWSVAPDSLSDGLTTVRVTVRWTKGESERRVHLSSTFANIGG